MAKIFPLKPHDFETHLQVSACYVEVQGKLLILHKSGVWSVPAGKVEKEETPEHAAHRELFEETQITADPKFLKTLYIRKKQVDFVFHMFHVPLPTIPHVRLSPEHDEYRWLFPQEIEELPLMEGALELLHHYLNNRLKLEAADGKKQLPDVANAETVPTALGKNPSLH